MADDLTTPLGQRAKKKPPSTLPAALLHGMAGVFGLTLIVFVVWAAVTEDPLGGEPVAVAVAELPAASAKSPKADPTPAKGETLAAPAATGPAAKPPLGTRTITIIDGTSGKREEVVIPTPGAARGANANAVETPVTGGESRLLENSRHGPIPKIAPDGTRAAEAYARPVKVATGKPDAPRIAIVVSGLGIGTRGTMEALSKLPAPITFAFAPYGAALDQITARARAEGHEVLLQVPMEPFDYPDNDPGPQTLLTTHDTAQNLDRLHWLMSRFQGYVGVISYMGARFSAAEQALSPVVREVGKRGLIYVDDGTAPRSLATQIAGAHTIPFAKSDVAIDAVPTGAEIDRALARLEGLARERGVAVGVLGSLPIGIERLTKWAKAAESRGFVLVPISAVANKAKSS